jgi:CubicO group peptidase (beta-lactamase class C family)
MPEFAEPNVLVSIEPLTTRPAKREITIRHLLTHTSGLAYNSSEKLGNIYNEAAISGGLSTTGVTLEQMTRRLAALPLLFDPGEKFEYGMSTDVLGRVVEVVSGMTLDRYFADRILQPLGMSDTYFKLPPQKVERLVAAYCRGDAGIEKLKAGELGPNNETSDYPYVENHRYLSGGGGLCSTASDYMRFCQMLLGGGELDGRRLLRKETIDLMTTNQVGHLELADLEVIGRFGFGFTSYPDEDRVPEQLRGAYAWFGAWSTSFRISPRGDWILVTMSQLLWDEEATPKWFAEYERIAAEAAEAIEE